MFSCPSGSLNRSISMPISLSEVGDECLQCALVPPFRMSSRNNIPRPSYQNHRHLIPPPCTSALQRKQQRQIHRTRQSCCSRYLLPSVSPPNILIHIGNCSLDNLRAVALLFVHCVAILSTLVRLGHRFHRQQLWWDDFWAFVALLAAILVIAIWLYLSLSFDVCAYIFPSLES